MSEIKTIKIFSTDDSVKMVGGKCKGCEGVIVKVMKLFCSVRLTKDKKGTPVFSDKPNKVKREHIVIIPPPPIQMPTSDDLKAVDNLEPLSNLIDENGVKSQLPSVDDCINLRDENDRLRLQVEALVSWQSHASSECAKFRKDYMDLKKKYDEEAVKYRKEELIDLIKNL